MEKEQDKLNRESGFTPKNETHLLTSINSIFRERINCHSVEDLAQKCLKTAEQLTGSLFGFIGELNPFRRLDTIALSNPGWEQCSIPQTQATMLLSNMELKGIYGEVLLTGKSLIVNDPSNHPAAIGIPPGHPPLTSFLGSPLKKNTDETIGMIAVGNKPGGYTETDQYFLEGLTMAIVQSLKSKRTEEKVALQSQEILEISTPVMQLWNGIVAAPIIGMLDSQRTQLFMEKLLGTIVKTNSPIALVDITGVPTVDTQTAQHLVETITASRLLGAEVILTGVSPTIAQTLVHLGIDLSTMKTCSSLANGVKLALDLMELQVIRCPKPTRTNHSNAMYREEK